MYISGKSIHPRKYLWKINLSYAFSGSTAVVVPKTFNWEVNEALSNTLQKADEIYIRDFPEVKSKIQAFKEGGVESLAIVSGNIILYICIGFKGKE